MWRRAGKTSRLFWAAVFLEMQDDRNVDDMILSLRDGFALVSRAPCDLQCFREP